MLWIDVELISDDAVNLALVINYCMMLLSLL